jgi:hypothetical protein
LIYLNFLALIATIFLKSCRGCNELTSSVNVKGFAKNHAPSMPVMKKNGASFQVENGHYSIPDRLKWLPYEGHGCKNCSRKRQEAIGRRQKAEGTAKCNSAFT